MNRIDVEPIESSKTKTRKTRKQKRQERKEHSNRIRLNVDQEEFERLQTTDPTLQPLWEKVQHEEETNNTYFQRDRLLYRKWIPPGRSESMDQLVLPEQCRRTVIQVAHSIPIACHLGRDKTTRRVLQKFYWPTLFRDIAKFCQSCEACQKVSATRPRPAPLKPLPVMDEPFKRIAMDIIGLLPKSRSGKRFVLVICDYATRYPEAVALKSIDAAIIAEELVKVFARVGIPEEVLTDQGSNFTSKLLAELYNMLHVHIIRTSPYHPQTDGLVERFNGTLKMMLRKTAAQEGKDWDKLLPHMYVLFAYREVP